MSNVAVLNPKGVMSPEDLQVLKDSMFRGFSDSEIKFSLAVAGQLNLSPLLRQVHFVKRYDKKLQRDVVTPQTGIDGFRLIADRTGLYAGNDEPAFEYEDTDLKKKNPIKATATVYKIVGGQRVPFKALARWDEFYPGDTMGFMWKVKPHIMLGKCAEAQALRKAFPAELSSVYADEELEHSDAGAKKAAIIQEKIMGNSSPHLENKQVGIGSTAEVQSPPLSPQPETETIVMPSFEDFDKADNPGDFIVKIGKEKKFLGKKLSEFKGEDAESFKLYLVTVSDWFKRQKININDDWIELFAKAEAYFGDVG